MSVVSIKIPFYIIFGPIFRKDLCGFHGIIVSKKLQELCIAYDCLSGPERQESLIEFLGKFSCTDNIPNFSEGDIEAGSDIASSSDSESE